MKHFLYDYAAKVLTMPSSFEIEWILIGEMLHMFQVAKFNGDVLGTCRFAVHLRSETVVFPSTFFCLHSPSFRSKKTRVSHYFYLSLYSECLVCIDALMQFSILSICSDSKVNRTEYIIDFVTALVRTSYDYYYYSFFL